MQGNVLIVDNDLNITASLEFLLRHIGFNCLTADSYAAAIDVVTGKALDAALIDSNLPDRSGYSLCQKLLSTQGFEHLPILMLTSQVLQAEQEKALSLGAMDFIIKPFNPLMVMQRIQDLLTKAA
ncbi:response regulator [Spiribacter sp. C176]|uniref:Response regulator n=1 Tax=Spiribacter salilacus TaxID=2664894 RepID=A0A6N7QQ15_9GAMM|nr:response regulator [Spiribacter salilacus]MRH77473.1 response regulator [Spiribacter salilacus]